MFLSILVLVAAMAPPVLPPAPGTTRYQIEVECFEDVCIVPADFLRMVVASNQNGIRETERLNAEIARMKASHPECAKLDVVPKK